MKARAVLLTGAPGSGKSTLARMLSEELRVPFLARDDVRGGLMFTAGAWTGAVDSVPTADEAVELFLALVETMLGRGVSCVAEYVVRTHRPEDLERILAAGDCVVVRTASADANRRFAQRNLSDRLISNPAMLHALGYASVRDHTVDAVARMREVERQMLTSFPVPVLDVDTTDGYDPSIEGIIDFALTPARRAMGQPGTP